MQNKRRFVVFAIFVLCMFFLMTFAGGANNDKVATRDVEFIDGFDNSTISLQKVEVGKDAEVPEDPEHENYVFAGWFLYEDHDIRVTDFEEIMEDLKVIALYAGDLNNNGIADEDDEYFTVTFMDSLTNTVIDEQEVLVGLDATAPQAPVHNGYTFTGWSQGYTNVQSDITVNALYRNNPVETYSVTFIDGDTNEVFDTQTIERGSTATLPEPPKHEGRVFDHWEGEYTNITADTTITAVYTDDKNNDGEADDTQPHYTVTYVDFDDTELEVFEDVLVDLETPTIADPEREYYTFEGWDPEVADTVTDNATYKATYAPITDEDKDGIADEEEDKFTVIYNVDGTETKFENLVDGIETPTIADPDKEYAVFGGWDPEVAATVTANVTYTATWLEDKDNDNIADETENKYTVIYNVDGTETKFENLVDGIATPTIADPDKEYAVFGGWDPEVAATVTANVTYTATWLEDKDNDNIADETENKYTVIYNVDGTETKFENLVEGIATPTIADPDKEYVVFGGWDPEVAATVTANVTYTATWLEDKDNDNIADETEKKYTVIYNVDGTETKFENLVEGIATPTIADPDKEYAVFGGWDPEVAETVTADATYTATWLADENNNNTPDSEETMFTVIYKDYDGTVIKTFENQVIGKVTPKVADPVRENYEFTGWNPAVAETVTATVEYTATYRPYNDEDEDGKADEEEDKFTVIYNVDGTETKFENLVDGIETPTIADPDKEYAVFGGWDPEVAATVTANVTYTATWLEDKDNDNIADEDEKKYTVIYNVDGTETKFENLVDGIATPTIADPDKEKAVFGGWDPAVAATVTANVTYTATWLEDKDNDNIADEDEKHYTVTYKDGETELAKHENLVEGIATPKTPEVADKEYAVFGGWNPEVAETVTADATYSVVWLEDKDNDNIADEDEKHYTVTYKDGETVLEIHENLVEGIATPKAPEVADKEYAVFGGWNPEVTETVTATVVYNVVWLEDKDNDNIADETENKYTVTYKDGETVLATHENQVHGIETPKAPEVADKEYAVFGGWEPTIAETVTKDATYTVVWLEDADNDNNPDKDEKKFTVTYKDGETVLATHENQVHGIETPKAPEVADKEYAVFGGWEPTIAETVTKDATYAVVWLEDADNDNNPDKDEKKFTVTYKDGEKELAKHENLVEGIATPAAPEVADKEFAVFGGWDPEVTETVTADATYTVVWLEDADNDNNPDKDEKKFTVTYKDGEKELAKHENLVEGIATPAAPEVADKDYAVFGGWEPAIAETVTADATYTVVWLEDVDNDNEPDKEEDKFTVTYKDGETELAKHENLVEGIATPKAPEVADKEYAVFGGWEPAIAETVTADATYTVVWLEDKDNDNNPDVNENKYTVVYKDGETELAKHENLVEGIATPKAPEVTDKEYAVFGGWNPAVAETVTKDATYSVVWLEDKDNDNIADEDEDKFTVTYKDGETVLATHKNQVHGITTPAAPEVADKEYAVFGGWNPAVAATVTADATYTVVWLDDKDNDNIADEDEKHYTVIYNVDGTETKFENLVDGIATPTIADPDKEYAVFGGWDPEVAATVTANVTYTATWLEDTDNDNNPDKDEAKFTVTYKDGETELAKHENLVEGIATPAAPEVADKEYAVFGGWEPAIAETVTADATYTVVWLADENNNNKPDSEETMFTVIYKDYDGTVIKTFENQVVGKVTPKVADPVRENYEFTGWNPAVAETVTATVEYTATYRPYNDEDEDGKADEEEDKFTVIYNVDGTETKFENLVDGIATPTIADPDKEYAVFGGWDPEVAATVTANVTYTATWLEDKDNDNIADETENKYTVTYVVDGEDYKVYENQVEGIATPVPEKPEKTYYNFTGWNPAVAATVTANVTYTATFAPQNDTNGDGVADELQRRIIFQVYSDDAKAYVDAFNNLVTIGEDVAQYIPTVPTRNYYTFTGWNPEATGIVVEDKTYTAKYNPINDTNEDGVADEEQRRVIFQNWDGTELLNELVTIGEATPVPETNPTRNEYYTFAGWDPEVAATVTADATYTAKYTPGEDKNGDGIDDREQTLWEVRFFGFGGATAPIGDVQYVLDGKAAVAPEAPAVSGYAFQGWLQDFSNVTSNLEVYSSYIDIEAPYINPTVTLYNYDSDAGGYLNANIKATVTDNDAVKTVKYLLGEHSADDYATATEMTAAADGTYQINGLDQNSVYTIFAEDMSGNVSVVHVEVEGIVYADSSGSFEDLYATGTFGKVTGNFLQYPYSREFNVTTKSNVKIIDARYYTGNAWSSYKTTDDFLNDPTLGTPLEHTDTTISTNISTGVLARLTVYVQYEKTVEVAPGVYETHTEEKVYTAFMSMLWG